MRGANVDQDAGEPEDSAKLARRALAVERGSDAGCVIWLTGLPSAGKTTLALALELVLVDEGADVVRLDGDELRRGVSADLGYSLADRSEHVRRVATMASKSAASGQCCIAALISPLRLDRARARAIVAPRQFVEVYVATPLVICRQRDAKGLYARAERGEIADFTGISSPYEAPESSEIVVHPQNDSVSQCVTHVMAGLRDLKCAGVRSHSGGR
jgi:adenylyl-sulfate kinase